MNCLRDLCFAATLVGGACGEAAAGCRQALALGLDVSGSVDLREYRLQIDGVIAALNDPDVMRILFSVPGAPVMLMVYEWSGPEDQLVLVPWTSVTDREALADISATLAATERRDATPGTALGVAMGVGAAYLDQQTHCWKRTLDISGDGTSNLGPRPGDVKAAIGARGITINALVIGADAPASGDLRQSEIGELSSYFRTQVITGPDAFVQTALGFDEYAAAMTAKLKRELDGLAISALQ